MNRATPDGMAPQEHSGPRWAANTRMSTQTVQSRAPRERSLGYALMGGAAITLLAMLVGGGFFAWILLAARGPTAPELLPADTQLYGALAPNVGGVVEVEQLQRALREGLGITNPAPLLPAVERLMGVPLGDGNVGTWLGSEMIVAVRGANAGALGGADAAEALLRDGELLFILGSKNDPQASSFLEQHLAAREARGETILAEERGEATIYVQEGGAPSVIAAFGLIDHYVVFSNSPEALRAMADAEPGQPGALAAASGFAQFSEELSTRRSGAIFTDGSADAEAARAALRELLLGL